MPDTINCDPAALTAAAKCFDCIPRSERDAVEIYLLAVIAGVALDPAAIVAAAKCFSCVPREMVDPVKMYLICTAANAET